MDNIFNRQLSIINPEKLQMPILVIGAGSIGSWVCLALSKLGCSNITVMDGDIIEEHNAGSQIYKSINAGEEKVATLIEKIDYLTDRSINAIGEHWNLQNPKHTEMLHNYQIVIAAVDNITTRAQLFKVLKAQETEHVRQTHRLYIDARMAGNALEIYTVRIGLLEDHKAYELTLFPEGEEILVECSERSVVYNVFIVAGLITDIVSKRANGQDLPRELVMDLFNFTLYK